jgi:hypothetical protein
MTVEVCTAKGIIVPVEERSALTCSDYDQYHELDPGKTLKIDYSASDVHLALGGI